MMKNSKLFKIAVIALCVLMSLSMLAACGGGSGGSVGDAEAEEQKDPAEKFQGQWIFAAEEYKGFTVAGDFSQLTDMTSLGCININADGTGDIVLGSKDSTAVPLTWTLKSDDVITAKLDNATDYTAENIDLTFKNDALWLDMSKDDETATGIFTHDGVYPEAKVIKMDEAEAITSKNDLVGNWVMTGMQMMGISMYGDPEAMKEQNNGQEIYMNFKDDGTVEMAAGSGTWKIDENGATLYGTDVTGDYAVPVKKMGDDIVVDYTGVYNSEWIFVLSKK